MPLIRVPEHSPEDLAAWDAREREDAAWARLPRLRDLVVEATAAIEAFATAGPCYISTSWGKDSVVLCHLAYTLAEERGVELPVAWARLEPFTQPHCYLVRGAFLARWPVRRYIEDEARFERDAAGFVVVNGRPMQHGWLALWMRKVGDRIGTHRYVTGIRADEAAGRAIRVRKGLIHGKSCAPLGHWTSRDIYAYLHANDLPVHPAYAMTFGGRLDRDRLRVASLGGDIGTEFGRREWEEHYYGSVRAPQ